MEQPIDIKRQHDRLMLVLSAAVAALIAVSLVSFAMWSNELRYGGMAMLLFDLDQEQNIPTWFSSVLLAGLAFGAWKLIPRRAARLTRLAYVALAAGFLFLSADEAALLHERIGGSIDIDGALSNVRWVIVWLPLLSLPGLVLLGVLWKHDARLAIGLVVGAVIYLKGAIGVETVNQVNRHNAALELEAAGIEPHDTRQFSRNDLRYGNDNLMYAAGTAIEEGLEKSGILIWTAVLLTAQRRAARRAAVSVASGEAKAATTRETKPRRHQVAASH